MDLEENIAWAKRVLDSPKALSGELLLASALVETSQHASLLESLLREAEKFCPRSLTGGDELANRIEAGLKPTTE